MPRKIRVEPFIGGALGAVLGFFAGGALIWWQSRDLAVGEKLALGEAMLVVAVWGGFLGLLIGAVAGFFVSLTRRNR